MLVFTVYLHPHCQVASSRTAHCTVSGSSPTGVLGRPTQPSTLRREENEYVPSGAESSEIHCLDNCEDPCYVHSRWHSGRDGGWITYSVSYA